MKIRTVEINRDGRKVLINKSDFDPDRHVPWGVEPDEWRRDRAKPGNAPSQAEKVAPDASEKVSEGDYSEWEALSDALVEAGERKPHPNTKLETLREKVASL